MKKILFPSLVILIMVSSYSQVGISSQVREEIKKEVEDQLNSKKSLFEKVSSKVRFFGDFRIRPYEQDWDVTIANRDGARADNYLVTLGDRGRTRLRFRLNVEADITENVRVHGRVRSGDDQDEYITAGGNDESQANFLIDKLYVKFHKNNFWATIGRNTIIFQDQKGLQWDIPNNDGFAVGYNHDIGDEANLDLSAAYYAASFDQGYFHNDGYIFGGQAVFNAKVSDDFKFKARTSIALAYDIPSQFSFTTVGGVHVSDQADEYAIWNSGIQLSLPNTANLTLAADYYNNLSDYDENPISIHHDFDKGERDFTDQTNGYVISLLAGSLSPNSFYGGVSWVHMEKYSAIDFYSQYDFNRTAEFATTNFEGVELRFGYGVTDNFNILARAYFTDQLLSFSPDPDETGSARRFRIDLNYSF